MLIVSVGYIILKKSKKLIMRIMRPRLLGKKLIFRDEIWSKLFLVYRGGAGTRDIRISAHTKNEVI